MNNEPVALTQADILGILQDANSVPLGQPIFNSSEEYNKLKAIIESTIRYTHLAKTENEPNWKEMYWWMHELNHKHWSELDALKTHPAKTLTDEEIIEVWCVLKDTNSAEHDAKVFARAILRKANEK